MRLKKLRTTLAISLVIFAIVVGMVIATGTITNYYNSQNMLTTYSKQSILQSTVNNAAAQATTDNPPVQNNNYVANSQQNPQSTASQDTQSQNTQASQNTVSQPAPPAPQPPPVIIQTVRTRAS